MDQVRIRGAVPFRARLVCCVLSLGACAPSDPPIVMPSNVNAAAIDRLIERIDMLVAVLGRTPATASLATTAVQEGERTRVADDSPALLARIEALEQAIASLHAGGSSLASSVTPRHGVSSTRREVVAQLRDRLGDEMQREEARRSLFMLTTREVLERLGVPDFIGRDGATLTWEYRAADRRTVSIGFVDGEVMHVSGWDRK